MTEFTANDLKQKITTKLDILIDDTPVTDDAMTFYPHRKLNKAENVFNKEIEVLKGHRSNLTN